MLSIKSIYTEMRFIFWPEIPLYMLMSQRNTNEFKDHPWSYIVIKVFWYNDCFNVLHPFNIYIHMFSTWASVKDFEWEENSLPMFSHRKEKKRKEKWAKDKDVKRSSNICRQQREDFRKRFLRWCVPTPTSLHPLHPHNLIVFVVNNDYSITERDYDCTENLKLAYRRMINGTVNE